MRLAAESALRSLKLKDGMAKSFLEQILRDSDRMNELISDLLDLSSMESSDIEMEIIDLHEVISNEISYLSKQIKREWDIKRQKLKFLQIMMIFTIAVKNLIKNALKYSPLEENIFIKTEMSDSEIICSFLRFWFWNIKSRSRKDI